MRSDIGQCKACCIPVLRQKVQEEAHADAAVACSSVQDYNSALCSAAVHVV